MNKKVNLQLLICIFILCVVLIFTGCSLGQSSNNDNNINSDGTLNNNSNDINSDNTQNNNTDSNNNVTDDSNNDIDDGVSDDESMLIAAIPHEFTFLGKVYTMSDDTIDASSFVNMLGYLINEEDLTFWKNYDKSDNIMYAIDTSNATYRHTFESNLENRYELYTKDDTYNCLAIKDYSNNFIIFYINE